MKTGTYRWLAIGAVVAVAAAGCGSSKPKVSASTPTTSGSGGSGGAALKASAPGITPSDITIGLINDSTGPAASTFTDGVAAAQARVAMQNAQGGVDGRQLKLVVEDTQSNPTTVQTAAQELVQVKHVFGVVSDSALMFGGSTYLTKAGVPVTGDTFDGPEWGNSPNMFSYGPPTYTVYGGTSYSYNDVSKLLKMLGVKKPAVLAFASPSAALSAKQLVADDTQLGMKNCYLNTSVPFGAVDFTAIVLQIKSSGCDAAIGTFTASSNVALGSALQNAGLNNVKQVYYTSYAQSTLDSPAATAALQGTYSEGLVAAGHTSTATAVQNFYTELAKYDPSYKPGSIPDLGVTNSWDGVDTMIAGLKLAGPNPTRATFISDLRTDTGYTIGGLSATPVSFNYLTGHFPAQECANFVVLKGKVFQPIPADGSPICGDLVPYKGS
jgi:branched-chain amino acid transport system substrate-binding protein